MSQCSIEPTLQPITGETFSAMSANKEDGARSDIAADSFWGGRFERTFFDVRVFNCHAPSNQTPTLSSCYENKRRECELRICEVERASFTPIVLSSTGGMGNMATTTHKWGTPCIQSDHGVASLPSILFPFAIIHTVHQRSTIKSRTCDTPPSLHRTGSQRIYDPSVHMSTLKSFLQLSFITCM